jgi:hypothetical protein
VTRYCITATAADRCHLRISSEVRYPRGEPWAITRTFIEKNAYDSLKGYFEHLFGNMAAHVAKNWLGLVPPSPTGKHHPHAGSSTPKSHSRKSSQGAKLSVPAAAAAAAETTPASAVTTAPSQATTAPPVSQEQDTSSGVVKIEQPVTSRGGDGSNQVWVLVC